MFKYNWLISSWFLEGIILVVLFIVDDIELQLNISKKPIHIPEFQYDKYYFQLKVAQAKESTE